MPTGMRYVWRGRVARLTGVVAYEYCPGHRSIRCQPTLSSIQPPGLLRPIAYRGGARRVGPHRLEPSVWRSMPVPASLCAQWRRGAAGPRGSLDPRQRCVQVLSAIILLDI
eukprot:3321068-Prymnesium_polylepis.1